MATRYRQTWADYGNGAVPAMRPDDRGAWVSAEDAAELEAELSAVEAELERRTAWSNEQIAKHDIALAIAEMERDDAELRERHLEAELRKYEPSDGEMHQQLGMLLAIKEAARLLELYGPWREDVPSIEAWRALPVVAQARKMP